MNKEVVLMGSNGMLIQNKFITAVVTHKFIHILKYFNFVNMRQTLLSHFNNTKYENFKNCTFGVVTRIKIALSSYGSSPKIVEPISIIRILVSKSVEPV